MKKFFLIIWLLLPALGIAQIPNGYYDDAVGLTGLPLKTALYNIILGHTVIQYDDLYGAYVTTDNLPTNKVWDMYSIRADGTADYWFTNSANNSDQCGNYSAEGDCYNREHSLPQSWFNEASPMVSDLFHVYPTDGKVNGQRGDLPFGDVGSVNWTSTNGSVRGTCATPGYTGIVFEPIDSFKGDFARTYFYMATRYQNVVAGWPANSTTCAVVFAGNSGLVFYPWYVTMLLSWSALDPVSTKEINRNNAVYAIQDNRNPYIDHPEWILDIWGPTAGTDEESAVNYFNVFPSPATNTVNLDFRNGIEPNEAYLFDLQGRKILTLSGQQSFSVEDLPSGFYVVKCIFSNIASEKALIVTH